MGFEVISPGNGWPDYEVWTCDRCGRSVTLQGVGGDVSDCICEYEDEFQEV